MAKPMIVTGVAGFLGRNVVAELNARGENEPILIDKPGCNQTGVREYIQTHFLPSGEQS